MLELKSPLILPIPNRNAPLRTCKLRKCTPSKTESKSRLLKSTGIAANTGCLFLIPGTWRAEGCINTSLEYPNIMRIALMESRGSKTIETPVSGRGQSQRVKGGDSTLNPELLDSLSQLDACILANAIESFHARLRNEGFVDHTVHCLSPHLQPMVGYAATLKIRGSAPPTAGGSYSDKPDWWDYVLSLPSPRVLVVQDAASRPGLGAWIGVVEMNILHALDCVGVVTNGAVRDVPAAESAGFHLFASNVSVSRAYTHVVEIGGPVDIGGLRIRSGELLHGDQHGVQSIPLDIAAQVPQAAAQIRSKEEALVALCRSPGMTLQKLRAAVECASD